MILPDHAIRKLGQTGMIEPFESNQVQPSSYDVRLDRLVRAARPDWHEVIDLDKPAPDWTTWYDLDPNGYVLRPGECVLGSTIETVAIPADLCCRVDGKSSLARFFLQIHSAGFVDPGYQGNITLEIVNFGPRSIRLRHRCLIAQLEFMRLTSAAEKPYAGRYQHSQGAIDSRYNEMYDSVSVSDIPQSSSTPSSYVEGQFPLLQALLDQPVDRLLDMRVRYLTDPDNGPHNSA